MAEQQQIEVFLVVDSAGDHGIGKDLEAARAQYEEDVQPLAESEGFRTICVRLNVPLPSLTEIIGSIPENGGEPAQFVSAVQA